MLEATARRRRRRRRGDTVRCSRAGDGIPAQLVRRRGRSFLWSRGEELITERFPETAEAAALLPDGTVLDGELLPWAEGGPLPFAQLQRRIGRKRLTPKILAEVPVGLLCYDLLEHEGAHVRDRELAERRGEVARSPAIGPSPHRWRPAMGST